MPPFVNMATAIQPVDISRPVMAAERVQGMRADRRYRNEMLEMRRQEAARQVARDNALAQAVQAQGGFGPGVDIGNVGPNGLRLLADIQQNKINQTQKRAERARKDFAAIWLAEESQRIPMYRDRYNRYLQDDPEFAQMLPTPDQITPQILQGWAMEFGFAENRGQQKARESREATAERQYNLDVSQYEGRMAADENRNKLLLAQEEARRLREQGRQKEADRREERAVRRYEASEAARRAAEARAARRDTMAAEQRERQYEGRMAALEKRYTDPDKTVKTVTKMEDGSTRTTFESGRVEDHGPADVGPGGLRMDEAQDRAEAEADEREGWWGTEADFPETKGNREAWVTQRTQEIFKGESAGRATPPARTPTAKPSRRPPAKYPNARYSEKHGAWFVQRGGKWFRVKE